MKNSHELFPCSVLWCRDFTETFEIQNHTQSALGRAKPPQPVQILCINTSNPCDFSQLIIYPQYIHDVPFTHDQLHVSPSNHRPAAIWSLESISTKSSTDLELKHLTAQLSLSLLPSPATLVFWNVLQAFGNFGGWQNTVPKNITEDSLHFLSAKSSLLCSWQPCERAKYYQHFPNGQK